MDDKWSDILYLIFVVLLLVVGALKKMKAKKPVAHVPKGETEILDNENQGFEMVFESLFGGETVQKIKEEKALRTDTIVNKDVTEDMKLEKKNTKNETFYKGKFVERVNNITELQLESEEEYDFEDIDWREAIIHSEILNRKY